MVLQTGLARIIGIGQQDIRLGNRVVHLYHPEDREALKEVVRRRNLSLGE